MGKIYKTKKGSGCKCCKPHKGGWEDKKKYKERETIKELDKEIEIEKEK